MEIPDFYRGRSVLLTGGTGFIGKAVVEKLLRCCPEVERIYLLVREKRGVDAKKRLSQLLALPVFAGCPIGKVTAVAGDASLPGLGLSAEDRDVLVSNVSVVLHSAATVSFAEPLRVAVPLNVEAVHHVAELARDMEQLAGCYTCNAMASHAKILLKALVHVSTAFSNCNLPSVREEVYPPPADVRDIIRRAKEDGDALERDTPWIIGDRPNTYTFTKALAESLLAEEAADLPVAIVRPSIVGWAWRYPSPGYTDNANGLMGPFNLVALGVVRSAFCESGCVADTVPVDFVVNTVLAAAWHTARQRPPEPRPRDHVGAAPRPPAPPAVYNCVAGTHNPVPWGTLLQTWVRRCRERPPARAVWWPSCPLTTSPWRHQVSTFLTMVLPAALHDSVVAPLMEKPARLLPKQRKLARRLEALHFFTTQQWHFQDDNVRALWSLLSDRDRVLFPLDVEAIDWDAYCKTALAGTKLHLLREEGVDGNPRGLYLLHRLTQTALTCAALLTLAGCAFVANPSLTAVIST